jgi:hypothetical protein
MYWAIARSIRTPRAAPLVTLSACVAAMRCVAL